METYLIAGLGNPGSEYKNTRHNVGFMFVDYIVEKLGASNFNMEKKFNAETTNISIEGKKLILAKPQTYMNNSGESIIKLSQYFQISNENIYIVHDDLDINLNEYKIQFSKGPRQHNGIVSIECTLNTTDFHKVRIGIENRGELRGRISGKDYVLANFIDTEKEAFVNTVFPKLFEDLKSRIGLK